MSPVSRGRKRKKSKPSPLRRVAEPELVVVPDDCDCPVCSGAEEVDPRQMAADLLSAFEGLSTAEDPLDAEIAAATVLSAGQTAGDGFEEALIDGLAPQMEAMGGADALVMLSAIAALTEGRTAAALSASADRLAEAGVTRPDWAAELAEPVTVDGCVRIGDSQDAADVLACAFHRAGRSHAVMLTVDNLDCGAASGILLFEVEQLPEALDTMRTAVAAEGLTVVEEKLDPAEFRWQVERAMDARQVHDDEDPFLDDPDDLDDDDDEGMPPYHLLAPLLRARMRALPVSDKPKAAHGDGHESTLDSLTSVFGQPDGRRGGRGPVPRSRGRAGAPPATLPAKRKKADGPAPIYQLKVGLKGSRPPIWRRVEVPADINLAKLHRVIQVAFGWEDCHLHVFETPYGSFGVANRDLDHQPESRVTLEQVAAGAKSTISYTYDFGDGWEHDILVEKVLDRDPSVRYPRCTGGRRGAPPEDCGGIWGYQELIEVLADPEHPEHEERMEWLGLDTPADFDPAHFDAEATTKSLSTLR
ncbi:plasmid pRiA4b ORF-3 family protein [Micromonospora zhanjiangensis]|uniref:Plasmid pRiA4b ORF-3 family protein n=1 Tax=Micromonospora zhanjiangensis TaxID=1522057 RepID=A0ABV8KR67_9ACTN